MNNDNIIEEKVVLLEDIVNCVPTKKLLIEYFRTALLEIEQATVIDVVSTLECGCSHCHERAELVVSKFIRKTATPTDNNKEDGKPLETALAEATSN